MSPDQHRELAEEFCETSLRHLCKEIVSWIDTGELGRAPLFRKLTAICEMYAGIENGRKTAENMVKVAAMRKLTQT